MVRAGPNEHSVRTKESKPVRTHSYSLGAHSVAMRTMETPFQSLLTVEVETCVVLYACTTWPPNFATNMVCNFPDDEISWFTNRITNIRSRSGLILETYSGNLRNGKQYSAENLYLISRRQILPGIGSNHASWSHFRFAPVRTPPVRTGANSPGSHRFGPMRTMESQWL